MTKLLPLEENRVNLYSKHTDKRHKLELAKYEKKEKKIRELAMEQKKRNETNRGHIVTYKI